MAEAGLLEVSSGRIGACVNALANTRAETQINMGMGMGFGDGDGDT